MTFNDLADNDTIPDDIQGAINPVMLPVIINGFGICYMLNVCVCCLVLCPVVNI